MNGSRVTLALTAALAAASSLSAGRAPAQVAPRPQRKGSRAQAAPKASSASGSFKAREAPAGYSASPLRLVRGTILEEVVDPHGTGRADEDAGLYHVTTNLPAILAEGRLRSRRELRLANRQGAGLGGGVRDQAPDLVSVGLRLDGALRLLRGMRLMALAVHGRVAPQVALAEFKVINKNVIHILDGVQGVDPDEEDAEEFNRMVDDYERGNQQNERDVLNSANGEHPGLDLYDALKRYEAHLASTMYEWIDRGWIWAEATTCNSTIGFTERSTKFLRVDPDAIGLLQLAARAGAPVDMIPEECELRLRPEDLAIVGLWEDWSAWMVPLDG